MNKILDPVRDLRDRAVRAIQFEYVLRRMLLDRLDENDVQRFGFEILADFCFGIMSFAESPGKHIGPAPEHHHPIARQEMGEVSLHKSFEQGKLYIADTYNHKIKWLDLRTGWVLSEVGNGDRGYRDGLSGDAKMNEPNGLVFFGGLWYITDTGNHTVRVYDPPQHVISTLALWK